MYSPKIKESFIQELYQLKIKTGKAMTTQVNQAIAEYIEKVKQILKNDNEQAK